MVTNSSHRRSNAGCAHPPSLIRFAPEPNSIPTQLKRRTYASKRTAKPSRSDPFSTERIPVQEGLKDVPQHIKVSTGESRGINPSTCEEGGLGGACLKKRVQGYFPAGVRGVPEYKFPPRLGDKEG